MSSYEGILSLDIESDEASTISEYLKKLLITMWEEGESFSGKHPLGDFGWQWPVYIALINGGYVNGRVDEYGGVDFLDYEEADKLISGCIEWLFANI